MSAIFPSLEWLESLKEKLNNDDQYARIAKKMGRRHGMPA